MSSWDWSGLATAFADLKTLVSAGFGAQISAVDARVSAVDTRLVALEQSGGSTTPDLTALTARVAALETALTQLQAAVAAYSAPQ